MPRKLTKKRKQLAQKKAITKRLMAISLQVDKYIFKHKPLTIAQAENNLAEVTKYKDLCLHDARSLQVIEKLSRCMKAIIEEETNNEAPSANSESLLEHENTAIYAASPVYSLPEEDRTQMIEYMNMIHNNQIDVEIDADTPQLNLTSPIINHPMDKPDTIAKKESQTQKNITNIADSNEIHNLIEPSQNSSKDITKITAIDLTLNDENPDIDDYACSQSILNNLEISYIPDCSNNIFNNDSCAQDMAEIDKEINHIMEQENRVADITNEKRNIFLPPSTKVYDSETIIKTVAKPVESFIIQDVFSNLPKSNERIQLADRSANKPPKTKNMNKKNKVKQKANKNKKIKNTKLVTECSDHQSLNNTAKKPTKKNKPSSRKCKGSCNTEKVLNNKCENELISYESNKYPSSMKKKRFEEDLSWVENLKHIRTIDLEEYDHNLNTLIESFWENCHLPENWNDADFQ